ncbi:hypothetical protein KXW97_002239 [Aspergillus fumigatus]|nr:hypothetical protein KXW97_002239 [Aspergillus fumigatus]
MDTCIAGIEEASQFLDNVIIESDTLHVRPGHNHSGDDEWALSFCRVAYGLRAKLNAIDDDYIRDYILYVQKSPCHLSVTLDTENLYLSNWREIGVYDADFGGMLGKPLRMRAPDGYTDGLIFVMAQRSDDKFAPWEFNISLEASTIKRIVHDPLRCKYVELDEFWHSELHFQGPADFR